MRVVYIALPISTSRARGAFAPEAAQLAEHALLAVFRPQNSKFLAAGGAFRAPKWMRCLFGLLAMAFPTWAQELTARQVLDKVVATYSNMSAVHVVAERTETTFLGGHSRTAVSECELAAKPGERYFARVQQGREQAFSISDGNHIWRALDSRKQWSTMAAASLTGDREEEQASGSRDLHDSLESMLLYRFLALAKHAQDPQVLKQPEFKLGGEKVRGYLIRARTSGTEAELFIDQQRFVVLQSKERGKGSEGQFEITMKVKLLALDREVDDALFHFEPGPGWTEVETLNLPGERSITLTGERAADFTLRTLDGEAVALQNLHGNVVVLDFWATWCGPCRVEFPAVEKLRAEFSGTVRFFGISDEEAATVKKFVEKNHYEMPILLDTNHVVNRRYGIRAIPELLVIGRDSVVRAQFLGTRTEGELRKAIRAVVEGQ